MHQREIAERVGLSDRTISHHKTKQNWEVLKGAMRTTNEQVIINLLKMIADGTKPDAKEKLRADEIAKISASISKLSDHKTSIPQIINAFKGFNLFLINQNPELAKEINVYQDEYITTILGGNK
jgi:hypothetical protein